MEELNLIEVLEEETETTPEPSDEVIEESSEPVLEEELPQDQEQDEPTENELLIEYIKKELNKDVELLSNDQSNLDSSINSNSDSSALDSSQIVEELTAIKNELIYQTAIYDDYNDNNNLQSDINDISLTNMLLIVTFIGILFTALLNFGRRIF